MQNALNETRAAVTEEQDKENRKNYVILYRVPESTEDKRFCEQFVNVLQMGVVGEDLTKF